MKSMTLRGMAFWVVTVVSALLFAVPGAALLAGVPHFVDEMRRLGYPDYFFLILGGFKVLGAVVILAPRLPRLKEWAYAGMSFDVVCAALSRAAIGDDAPKIALPILIGTLVLASWALRPDGRRLRAP